MRSQRRETLWLERRKKWWVENLIRTVAGLLAEFGEAEAVEGVRVWVDVWVAVKPDGGECAVGAVGDYESVGEDYVGDREACERG
jgi:hypothetical protein